MSKTMNVNGRTFEVVTDPKMYEKIMSSTYCGGLANWYSSWSSAKQGIYDNWSQYFRDTASGHCSFGIASANTNFFTLICDIEICLEKYDFYSRPFRMYITPSHNYIVQVAD